MIIGEVASMNRNSLTGCISSSTVSTYTVIVYHVWAYFPGGKLSNSHLSLLIATCNFFTVTHGTAVYYSQICKSELKSLFEKSC